MSAQEWNGGAELAGTVRLASGCLVRFRLANPDDEPLIAEAFRTASAQTRLQRFLAPLPSLSSDQLRRMLTIDPEREICFVGCIRSEGKEQIICGARYVRLEDPTVAEIALTVHDNYQRAGLGRFLLRKLIEVARRNGIRRFVGDVLATNTAMMRLLNRAGHVVRANLKEGVYPIEVDLKPA